MFIHKEQFVVKKFGFMSILWISVIASNIPAVAYSETTTLDLSAYENALPSDPNQPYVPHGLDAFDENVYNLTSAAAVTAQNYSQGFQITGAVYDLREFTDFTPNPGYVGLTTASISFLTGILGDVYQVSVQVSSPNAYEGPAGFGIISIQAGVNSTTYTINSSQTINFTSQNIPITSVSTDSDGNTFIENLIVQSSPSMTLDLSVLQPIIATPPASVNASGVYQIAPGTAVTVTVPVAGVNFQSPETRSTTVTLQAGSQPLQTQTISLSAIQAAGGALNVPFTVTFASADSGTQVITATVDTGNQLIDSNFTNNTASVQVEVVPNAILIVTLPDTPLTQQSISGSTITAITPPSVLEHTGCGTSGLSTVTRQVVIDCIDPTILPPLSAHVDGCTYSLALSVTKDGGHHADYHTGKRPQMIADPDDGETDPQDIPPGGVTLTMTVPEVAGETTVVVSGNGPSQNGPLTPISAIFDVMVPNMFPLNQAELYFTDISHHPDDGFYGNYAFLVSLQIMLSSYSTQVLNDAGTPGRPIQSQAGSLSWGGLFDYPGKWTTPHCAHRDGSAVDLEFGLLSATEQEDLADAVYDSDNLTFYAAESPNPPNSVRSPPSHWHVMLIGSQQN